jgi:hypothetical protein
VKRSDGSIPGRDSCVAGNEARKSKNDFLLHAGLGGSNVATFKYMRI